MDDLIPGTLQDCYISVNHILKKNSFIMTPLRKRLKIKAGAIYQADKPSWKLYFSIYRAPEATCTPAMDSADQHNSSVQIMSIPQTDRWTKTFLFLLIVVRRIDDMFSKSVFSPGRQTCWCCKLHHWTPQLRTRLTPHFIRRMRSQKNTINILPLEGVEREWSEGTWRNNNLNYHLS